MTSWARSNDKRVKMLRFLWFWVLATLFLAPGCAQGDSEEASKLQVDGQDQACHDDSDCVVVSTVCSTCECGVPVNRTQAEKYEKQYQELCRDYHGGVCEYCCSTPFVRCLEERCALTNQDETGAVRNPCQ